MRYEIPSTVSSEAATGLQRIYAFIQSLRENPQPAPITQADWDQRNASMETFMRPLTRATADALGVTTVRDEIGGVPVLRLIPRERKGGNRALVYVHGGGYVYFSAETTLTSPALVAAMSGDEVISIDYTVAPRGCWQSATAQVLAVYVTLLERHDALSIGIFGDSAGGGLSAGSVFRMRDGRLPLPGALYLISPWMDVTGAGDTWASLADADPSLMETDLKWGVAAYAEPKDQRHPYVSPIYGDFAAAFPPTLIQGGTREIFVSDFVRAYQAIRGGGHEAVLDLYEGLPHVFQSMLPDAPETRTAIGRAVDFFDRHLTPR